MINEAGVRETNRSGAFKSASQVQAREVKRESCVVWAAVVNIFVICSIVALLAVTANAQEGVSVSGKMEDQTGGGISGAKVTLASKGDSHVRKAVTDPQGHFSFSHVEAGKYVLTGDAQDFKKITQELHVHDHDVADITLAMPINDEEEIVSVTATRSQSDAPENNADAVYLNVDTINALPSQSQDILPVLNNFLSPAAQSPGGPSIVVDGIEGTDLDLPTNSLKRIDINRNPYSPEFRRPGLGRVEVTTRNGSRGHFDGQIATYLNNDVLDARNSRADSKPDMDRRLFEASLGGPFPINHARFFLSVSRLNDDESAVVNATTLQGPLVENVPITQTNTNVLGRIDLRPTHTQMISLMYNFHARPNDDRGVGGLQLPEHQRSDDDHRHRAQLAYTAIVSPVLLNVLRLNFERRTTRQGEPAISPEIDVSGAFTGGPNQSAESEQEVKGEVQDILSYTRAAHTFRFGASIRPKTYTFADRTDFNGTFTFPSLSNFASGNPALFQVVQGNPNVSFSQNEVYGFVEDQIKLNPRTTLMLGVRYDWQEHLRDHNDFAPRLAVGFSPGHRNTVLRAGAGIFYDHLSETVAEQAFLVNGVNAREFIIPDPSFSNPILAGVRPSIWSLAPDIRAPYLFQGSAGLEQAIAKRLHFTAEYQFLRGIHLLTTRDVNTPDLDGDRPDSNLFLDRHIQSSGSLRSHALITSLQGRVAKPVKIKAQYTFSKTEDNTDGPFALPVSSLDPHLDWGRSTLDVRHRFTLAAVSDLPWQMRAAALFAANSGLPFNVITGFDNNRDGVVNDRPAGVARNSGNGPGFTQLDLRLTKILHVFGSSATASDRNSPNFARLELNVDAFNIFNHTNLTKVIGVTSSPRFGLATTAFQPRTIQLSLKLSFRKNME